MSNNRLMANVIPITVEFPEEIFSGGQPFDTLAFAPQTFASCGAFIRDAVVSQLEIPFGPAVRIIEDQLLPENVVAVLYRGETVWIGWIREGADGPKGHDA